MTGVIDSGLAESTHTVAAWIVLLFHEHVERPILRQQPDGLPVAEACLGAITMLSPMLTNLHIAGEIDDFAYFRRDHRARLRLPSTEAPIVVGLHGWSGFSPKVPIGAV